MPTPPDEDMGYDSRVLGQSGRYKVTSAATPAPPSTAGSGHPKPCLSATSWAIEGDSYKASSGSDSWTRLERNAAAAPRDPAKAPQPSATLVPDVTWGRQREDYAPGRRQEDWSDRTGGWGDVGARYNPGQFGGSRSAQPPRPIQSAAPEYRPGSHHESYKGKGSWGGKPTSQQPPPIPGGNKGEWHAAQSQKGGISKSRGSKGGRPGSQYADQMD